MCWLLFLARSVCQGNRVLLGALLPFIVAEVAMPNDEKGRVLGPASAPPGARSFSLSAAMSVLMTCGGAEFAKERASKAQPRSEPDS